MNTARWDTGVEGEKEMKPRELSILFNGEMVRAILEGRKTQTRRVMKIQPGDGPFDGHLEYDDMLGWRFYSDVATYDPVTLAMGCDQEHGPEIKCPYGKPGDRLWVRETWAMDAVDQRRKPSDGNSAFTRWFKADDSKAGPSNCNDTRGRWRPSIFMPRWASRLAPVVTDVRVQRVQDISEEDAIAEGVMCEFYDGSQPISSCYWDYESKMWSGAFAKGEEARGSFRTLWDSINKKRGFGWDVNPFCWIISFKRLTE